MTYFLKWTGAKWVKIDELQKKVQLQGEELYILFDRALWRRVLSVFWLQEPQRWLVEGRHLLQLRRLEHQRLLLVLLVYQDDHLYHDCPHPLRLGRLPQ